MSHLQRSRNEDSNQIIASPLQQSIDGLASPSDLNIVPQLMRFRGYIYRFRGLCFLNQHDPYDLFSLDWFDEYVLYDARDDGCRPHGDGAGSCASRDLGVRTASRLRPARLHGRAACRCTYGRPARRYGH